MIGVILNLKFLGFALGIVGDDELYGIEHSHSSGGDFVEVVAQAVLQKAVFDNGVDLGYADLVGKTSDGSGSVASAAKTAQGTSVYNNDIIRFY